MMNKDVEISYYSNCQKPEEQKTISIQEVIDLIASDKFKDHTDYLRNESSEVKRREYKQKNLPAITFGGTFKYRTKDKLQKHSGFACLDIDDYNIDINDMKNKLSGDEYVYCVFTSPSGGIKIIVKIPIVENDEEYKIVFEQIVKHYQKYNPKNDTTSKDISRLCFLSYDPSIYVNSKANIFPIDFDKKKEEKEVMSGSGLVPNYCAFIEKVATKFELPSGSITRHGYLDGNIWQYCVKNNKKDILESYKKIQGRNDSAFNDCENWIWSCATIQKYIKENKKDFLQKCKRCRNKIDDNAEPTEKSWLDVAGILYEQVKGEKYVYRVGDGFSYVDEVEIDGEIFVPCTGDELKDETVILPIEPIDYGSVPKLVEEIKVFIHKWLDVSEEYETIAAWYVLLTWVYEIMPTVNYLSAMGDTGTGKSRYLSVIGRLCRSAILGSGGVTVAAVKRIVQKWR